MSTLEGRAIYANSVWNYEFDHKDHLGNTRVSFKANNGQLEKTAETAFDPWGVVLNGIGQQNAFQNRFEMQGKEKEATFGLNRINFGARTMNPTTGIWDRIDPLAEKMSRWSPYSSNFSNPLRFIDPDGMSPDIYITGDEAKEAFKQLQQSTSLKLSIDSENGKVTATGNAKTDADKKLQEAANDKQVDVNINATSSNYGKNGKWFVGGAFGGSEVKDGKTVANQTVNPKQMKTIDSFYETEKGVSMLHEVLEAYIGGVDSPGINSPTFEDVENQTNSGKGYLNAHNKTELLDKRHKAPNIIGDIDGVSISKYPYSPSIPAALNPEVLLFKLKK